VGRPLQVEPDQYDEYLLAWVGVTLHLEDMESLLSVIHTHVFRDSRRIFPEFTLMNSGIYDTMPA